MISRVIRAKWYLKGNILGIPCKPITMVKYRIGPYSPRRGLGPEPATAAGAFAFEE
jgi:hypothetical protein